jgi:hypothetical protein
VVLLSFPLLDSFLSARAWLGRRWIWTGELPGRGGRYRVDMLLLLIVGAVELNWALLCDEVVDT